MNRQAAPAKSLNKPNHLLNSIIGSSATPESPAGQASTALEIPPAKRNQAIIIVALIVVVTLGHYIMAPVHAVLHSVLQRLYFVPIIWAAYRFGKRGGVLAALLCGILYIPLIWMDWNLHPEYQVDQTAELALFGLAGYFAGLLFEQKANSQKLLQSYEKMAMFGTLSRSIIRSLKAPIRVMKGMLFSLEPKAREDRALKAATMVIGEEIEAIESIRNDLIALVERKKQRLKRQNLNEVMFDFLGEIEPELHLKKIRLSRKAGNLKLPIYLNKKELTGALRLLVNNLINNGIMARELHVHTGESLAFVWIGATVGEKKLSDDSIGFANGLNTDNYRGNHLISILNTVNNHYGDARFRWENDNLIEFLLLFPKKLKLPWYMRDEPVGKEGSSS